MDQSTHHEILEILSRDLSFDILPSDLIELQQNEGLSLTDALKELCEDIADEDDVEGIETDDARLERLDLFLTLLDKVSGDPAQLVSISSRKDIKTVRDAVLGLFPIPYSPTDGLRQYLYAEEPTAVIVGMLRSGRLTLNEEHDEQVLSIFEVLLEKDFDLFQHSIKSFCELWLEDDISNFSEDTRHILYGLQRLSVIVKDPEDISILLKAGFNSASSIAQMSLPSFVAAIEGTGDLLTPPSKIHSYATTVSLYNEQRISLQYQDTGKIDIQSLGLSMGGVAAGGEFAAAEEAKQESTDNEDLESTFDEEISEVSLAKNQLTASKSTSITKGSAASEKKEIEGKDDSKALGDSLKARNSAAASVILDMNLPENPDSLSVLSPAAYFVDLLQMLKGVDEDIQEKQDPIKSNERKNLQKRLLSRRPDLEKLQLSKANQDVEIPYIDLANEVMESVAWHFGNTANSPVVRNYDEKDYGASVTNLKQPQNVNYEVYSELISKQIAPLHRFPYNLGLEKTRSLMKSMRLSRQGLLEAFCTENTVAQVQNTKSTSSLETVERIKAAERLGLTLEDFILLTKTDFHGLGAGKTYSAHELWGYTSKENMLEVSDEIGLYFIEKQLLPRAGISFEHLVTVLKCRFFSGKIVINAHETVPQSEKAPNLASNLGNYRICSKGQRSITVPSCERLNFFLRLSKKFSWPVLDLDDCLTALVGTLDTLTLESSVIVDLAAISELAEIINKDRRSLLPLWTKGPSDLLSHLMRPSFELARISGIDKVFSGGLDKGQWPDDETLSGHLDIISYCVNLTVEDIKKLISSGQITDTLKWETLGALHGYSTLCDILQISITDYGQLLSNGVVPENVTTSPKETLRFVKMWRRLSTGDNADSIMRVFTPAENEKNELLALHFLENSLKYINENSLWPDVTGISKDGVDHIRSKVVKAIPALLSELLPDLRCPTLNGLPTTTSALLNCIYDGALTYDSIDTANQMTWNGHLFSLKEGSYIVTINGVENMKNIELIIGATKLTLTASPGNNKTLQSEIIPLSAGAWKKLEFKGKASSLEFSDNLVPAPLAFVPERAVKALSEILNALQTSASIVHWSPMEKPEMEHFLSHDYDTYQSRLNLLLEICSYNEIKSRTRGILSFLVWASQSSTSELLSDRLQLLTDLPLSLIKELLDMNFPGHSEDQRRLLFITCESIRSLLAQAEFMVKTNLSKVSPRILMECATGELTGSAHEASQRLWDSFQSTGMTSKLSQQALMKANEFLRTSRRDALICYLLNQEYVFKAGIKDADGLFEYFLIDVQMGPNQKTTRITQAISSTQLFVERCLLNLEAGVSASNFNKDEWTSWLGSYRKWEASRKIFLFPETWIDPTLRDNKTELFKELEVAMAQKQLDKSSMLQLVKNYIYGVHDLGCLQIESYFNEKLKGDEVRFHIFARTRPSPPKYYYRTMQYRNSGNIAPKWTPWQIIQVDVPMYEVDELGNALSHPGGYLIPFVWKNQLYLVMPQLVQKPGEDQPTSTLAMIPKGPEGQAAPKGTKTWGRYWELKLSWAIYRDGTWSPKVTSASALKIDSLTDDPKTMSDVSNLSFRVDSTPSSLNLYVERNHVEGSANYNISLGVFAMRGDNFVAVKHQTQLLSLKDFKENKLSSPTVKSTIFHKIYQPAQTWAENSSATPWPGARFALPPYQAQDTKWDTSWTLSYSGTSHDGSPDGLIVQIENTETGASATWFRNPDVFTSVYGSNADVRLYNVLSSDLIESATSATSLEAIFSTMSEFNRKMVLEPIGPPSKPTNDEEKNIEKKIQYTNWEKYDSMNSAYGKQGSLFFKETLTPYAIYNWELGFHIVSLFVERLAATRQYELALEVAHLVFDPTIIKKDDQYAQWLFHPFKDKLTRDQGKTYNLLSELPTSKGRKEEMPESIVEWRRDAFSPHNIARNRPSAYMKRLAMQYVQILVDAGDMHFRKGTIEAISTALQFYVEASHIFGPRPEKIPQVTKSTVRTYEQLGNNIDDFSNASVNLELINPFFVPFNERGKSIPISKDSLGFVKSMYFTIPANPRITALRTLIDDRFFKIRNCLDLNGQPRVPSLFGDVIDPMNLIQEAAKDRSLGQMMKPLYVELPRYRFKFLLQKALELCNELRGLGTAYLTAKERKDSEHMMIMKMGQDKLVNDLMLQMKSLQREEALKTLDQLQQSREGIALRLAYYNELTGDDATIPSEDQPFMSVNQVFGKRSTGYLRMSEEEETELEKASSAASWTLLANAMEFSAGALALIPPISTQAQPWGVGITVSSPPWGQGALIAASIFKGLSVYESEQGAHASRINRLMQQLQERRQQLNQAGQELKAADKSIIAHRARIAALDKDIEVQRQGMKNAVETLEYVKTKFNRVDLYNYLDQQTLMAFSHSFNLAFELSRHAREAFSYETGAAYSSPMYSEQDYWDDTRGGLLCAEKLSMTLRTMELEYLDKSCHDFEIVKHVSLRQIAPLALLKLRSDGDSSFSLSEEHFDFDFPGHTHRRIKSVSVSVPCTVGPYSSLNCILALQKSSYRVSDINDGDYAYKDENDLRFVQHTVQKKSIAISSGQQDSGVFDLDFNNEKYMPFEGEGAISTWNLHFPGFAMKQIDFDSISDVIIHIRYTSRDGGKALGNAASQSLERLIGTALALDSKGQFGLIDIKHDYAVEWHTLVTGTYSGETAKLKLNNLKERLPFYTKARTIKVSEIYILLKTKDNSTAITSAKLNGTEFTKQNPGNIIPDGFHCFGIQKEEKKVSAAMEAVPGSSYTSAWPQRDWIVELNCPRSSAGNITEAYLVFSFQCLSAPKANVVRK